MTKDEVKDFKDMKKVVESISDTVENMSICLMGDPKDHTSEGLVGAVNNNVNGSRMEIRH